MSTLIGFFLFAYIFIWIMLQVANLDLPNMRLKAIFAWYDLWIGIFIDTEKGVYIFPLPMFGLMWQFNRED